MFYILNLILFFCIFLLSACNNFNFGLKHCSQYTYSKDKKSWIDSAGKPVSCTIIDNNRIFFYDPVSGCEHVKKLFPQKVFKITELPIRVGSGESAIVQRYCVKQSYISLDNTGQVLLIDEGVFCLAESQVEKDEYSFTSCKGVKKKSSQTEEDAEKNKEDESS